MRTLGVDLTSDEIALEIGRRELLIVALRKEVERLLDERGERVEPADVERSDG